MPATLDIHGLSRFTKRLLLVALVLSVLHHGDHVLRVDHSGWPFRHDVTPFTFSLLAYPMIGFALLGPARLFWVRWAALAAGTGFTLFAHTVLESPTMQFTMWAHDQSLERNSIGLHNLLNVHSVWLGAAAVVISMTLNGLAVVATTSMFLDGVSARRNLNSRPRDKR
jgi:hypothetical protein